MKSSASVHPRRLRLLWAVFKRETCHYLQSPGTYIALAFFLILAGALFTLILSDYTMLSAKVQMGEGLPDGDAPLNPTIRIVTQFFSAMNFLVLFLAPILTMRLISEEKKAGTFELLVSTPLDNFEILLGKYFAALLMGTLVLVLSLVYPGIALMISNPEVSVLISCYAGLFLIMVAYMALGLFASSVTESQIAAAVLSFVGLLLFQMVDWLFKKGTLGTIAAELSVRHHSEPFTEGVIGASDVAFFILFAVFFLFLSAQALDSRRWRA